jgi:hypothetical protein
MFRAGNKEKILLVEYDLSTNEWLRFDLSLVTIAEPSHLVFESIVYTDDADVIEDDVNMAVDDVSFTSTCRCLSYKTRFSQLYVY